MKKMYFFRSLVFLTTIIALLACKKAKTPAPELTVTQSAITFTPEGGTQDLSFTCSSDWTISNPVYSWLQLSATSGNSGSTVIQVTTLSDNATGATRSGVLYINASNGQSRRVTVTQAPTIYQSYNTSPKAPDMTGMASNAVQLAAKMHMGMGINFGNTMESPNEGDWQNSKLTESYVKFIKQQGFNSVRIPCGWLTYHSSDKAKAKIDPAWLARVKEVVGWCVANDMYVMLNVHGDWGWLEDNVNAIKKDSVNAKQKALWEQIATTMRDFDEHVMFASTNEPKAANAEAMAILNGYHQTFINAVRSTGGRNAYRVLVVQGPNTDPTRTNDLMNTLPTDKIPNKLMVEVHDYTPATFTILGEDVSWGNMVYYWGAANHSTIEPDRNATFGEEDAIIAEFKKMKEKFVDKGIPVILGEYASMRRSADGMKAPKDMAMHNKSVEYWATFATKQAKVNGLLPFWWEVGNMFDRATNVVKDQALYDALKEGYK
jgi:endoglucanase